MISSQIQSLLWKEAPFWRSLMMKALFHQSRDARPNPTDLIGIDPATALNDIHRLAHVRLEHP
jgi:hypothetical protein